MGKGVRIGGTRVLISCRVGLSLSFIVTKFDKNIYPVVGDVSYFFFSFLIIFHLVTLNERRFGSLMIISLPLEIKGAPKAARAGGHICSLLHITRILLAKRYPPFLPTPFPPRGNGGLGARSLSLSLSPTYVPLHRD